MTDKAGGYFPFERLDVFAVAVEVVDRVYGLGGKLWSRHPALNRQLQRAAVSVLSNIGEGGSCLSRGDRARFFEYAYRSAGECAALILGARATGLLDPDDSTLALSLLTRTQRMLRPLITNNRRA